MATSYGGLLAWISGSSFVLQDNLYGLSPLLSGLVFAAATLGYGLGTLLAARLVGRIGIDRTIVCGGIALAAGGLAMAAAIAMGTTSAPRLAVPMAFYLCGLGLAVPGGNSGRAHAVSRPRGRRLIAAWLPATRDRVRDRTVRGRGGCSARARSPLAAVIAAMGVLALALALLQNLAGSRSESAISRRRSRTAGATMTMRIGTVATMKATLIGRVKNTEGSRPTSTWSGAEFSSIIGPSTYPAGAAESKLHADETENAEQRGEVNLE